MTIQFSAAYRRFVDSFADECTNRMLAEEIAITNRRAEFMPPSDPLRGEEFCAYNLAGHVRIAACGKMKCGHCGEVLG